MQKIFYYEDFTVNEINRYGSYTVTREEIIEFAQKWDPQPFHVDEAAAKGSIFGGLCASSAHTYAIATLLTHSKPGKIAILAGLGTKDMKLKNPVRPGDTLCMEGFVIEKRLSERNPDRGIVTAKSCLLNQNDEIVLEQIGSMLVQRKGQ